LVHAYLIAGGLLALLSGCASTGGGDGPPTDSPDYSHVPDAVPKVEPKSKYGNPKSYVVFGKRYYTKASARGHVEKGLASWYGKKFHGRRTSSGERYNMYAMTAAHKSLPLPTYAEVTNLDNGRSVVVKVNDRGPFHRGRVIDLSYAAARKLGVVRRGTAMVEVRSIDPRNPNTKKQKKRITEPESAVRVAETSSTARKASSASKKPTRVADDEPAIQIVSNSTPAKSKTARKATPETPDTPRVAAASSGPTSAADAAMYLQVGAFGSRSNAEQLRRQLVEHLAENVQVRAADGSKVPLYKVHVGPLDSRLAANDVSERLASLGLTRSHVVME
jgi:rare lipoprotein A